MVTRTTRQVRRAHRSRTSGRRVSEAAVAGAGRPVSGGLDAAGRRSGDSIAGGTILRVQHTPGHSPDHLAFWHEASRTVFAGDLVMPGGSVMIHAQPRRRSRAVSAVARAAAGAEAGAAAAGARSGQSTIPSACWPGPSSTGCRASGRSWRRSRTGARRCRRSPECIYDGLAPALMPAARENVRAHLEKLRREGRAFEADGRWTP